MSFTGKDGKTVTKKYSIDKDVKGIYRYDVAGKPVYIGKSTRCILDRLKAHENEEKFQNYLSDAYIYYTPMENDVEINAMEKLLITKYNPVLNVIDNCSAKNEVNFEDLHWECCKEPDTYSRETLIIRRKQDLKVMEEMVDVIKNELEATTSMCRTIKRFCDANKSSYCFTYTALLTKESSERDIPEIFLVGRSHYFGFPLVKEVKFSQSSAPKYPVSVDIHLTEAFARLINDDGIDKILAELQSKLDSIERLKYLFVNAYCMLDKINDAIQRSGQWGDLEDAGWSFLRMLNLQRKVYTPISVFSSECDEEEKDNTFWKQIRYTQQEDIIPPKKISGETS